MYRRTEKKIDLSVTNKYNSMIYYYFIIKLLLQMFFIYIFVIISKYVHTYSDINIVCIFK